MTTIIGDGTWFYNRAALMADSPERIARSVVSLFCSQALKAQATRFLLAFDGPQVFRHELWPLYKLGRKTHLSPAQIAESVANIKKALKIAGKVDSKREIYQHLQQTLEYVDKIGIPWIQPQKFEADDVLASAAHQIQGPVVLAAADKDLYQLLSPRVRMISQKYDPKIKKMVTRFINADRVVQEWGVPRELMLDLQTVIGDSGDTVPGIPGYGKAGTAKALVAHGSLKAWRSSDDPRGRALNNQVEHLRLNRKLVQLRTDVPIPQDLKLRPYEGDLDLPRSYKDLRASLLKTSLF